MPSVVLAGMLTLGIEMTAGRLLSPLLGSSLYQWAALIGTALVSYAIGYATHTRLLHFSNGVLMLCFASVYTALIPWLISVTSYGLLSMPLMLSSVAAAILAVALPSAIWAAYLPHVMEQVPRARTARLLAVSAAGNLLGVWGIAFVLIPYLGVSATVFMLALGGIVLASMQVRKRAQVLLVVISLALVIVVHSRRRNADHGVVQTVDTAYQRITIRDKDARKSFEVDGIEQFAWNPRERLYANGALNYFNFATGAAGWSAMGEKPSVLVVGAGGGLVPMQIGRFFPNAQITVHEIDPTLSKAVISAGFPLSLVPYAQIVNGDSRALLLKNDTSYDYIFLDAYVGTYLPLHFTSLEFFQLVRSRLNPGGVVVANFIELYRESGLLQNLAATMQSAFGRIYSAHLTDTMNTMLLGWNPLNYRSAGRPGSSPIPQPPAPKAGTDKNFVKLTRKARAAVKAWEDTQGVVLTDDRNDSELRLFGFRQKIAKIYGVKSD